MSGALLYLAARQSRNRMRARLARLRRPRYLLFALVGGAYFWFFAGRHWVGGLGAASATDRGALAAAAAEALAPLGLTAAALLSWMRAAPPAPLSFSEAEVHHFFPAPLPRRELIGWSVARAQPALIFSAVVFTLGAGPLLAPGARWILLAGAWLAFTTFHLHLTAGRLTLHGWQRAGVPGPARVAAVAASIGALVLWSIPPSVWHGSSSAGAPPASFLVSAAEAAASPSARVLLLPARLTLGPAFAGGPAGFLAALPGAILMLALHAVWLLRSRVRLEDGALEAAGEMAAARRGRPRSRNVPGPLRRAPAPFRLAPAGRPEAALAWKSLVRSIRVTSGLPLLAGTIVLGLVPALVLGLRSPGSALPAAGMICASLALVLLWVGPQILGADFASELLHIERLRSYPLSGPAILAGSLLAPVAVLTLLQWGLLGLFWILTLRELELPVDPALPVLAAGLFAPPLTFASALVQTGVTLLAPGWMTPGGGRPGGFESFGFTLVSAVARLVVLGTCVLPGMAVAGLACWAGSVAGSLEAGVAAGGVLGSAVVGAEGALGLALLGRRLERLDPSRELDAVRG